MQRRHFRRLVGVVGLGVVLCAAPAVAQPAAQDSVTVSFGVGLNTAQPGNAANHHVVPQRIKVKAGGVVNFVVAGFHQIVVYLPGRDVGDLTIPDPPATFVNDTAGTYYVGIVPVPPGAPGATTNPSNAINRVESIGFAEPGIYLVICNVRGHLLDGMYAYVEVTGQ
jgi:plastocyanin